MNITVLGIDLAKNVFQLHGVDKTGKVVLRKTISRLKLAEYIQKLSPCLIGMEACGSSHYWARKFQSYGHEVKLMNPQFVKPYVKTNKSDRNDAEAICEAVTRPNMRFVAIKNVEQQDIQSLHRIREGYIQRRTALANQIRGLLAEYGIIVAQGINVLRKALPFIVEDAENNLTMLSREFFSNLYQQLIEVDKQVKNYTSKLEQFCARSEVCQRISEMPGIGTISATAIVASVGDARIFKNGRQMSAWLGLVPRQRSSGGKQMLLGISKRGDIYVRKLFIHGARSVIRRIKNKEDKQSQWIKQIVERRGKNKAAVALANKNARVIWALMANESKYQLRN